ncbi:LDH2 family malate/lactate/ureidoglycolate dehydrogenase [Tamaricihabitans halophyticus]|uniref:LDH2 family malate/lactate/ureidoglycolate dehydrogenase n=1 Tax=Tamaricihabitans halophyticus TaxID=1262583 RepID=A0A4R2QN56_9PSEU|nr:Ldh family oxidoreductase [Tamaricihabitans halophyticus]TCP50028.1 LDH2 family malate/lactate/ureidoglycolate dehydrogenase [Tamaricihabitans halophyticus]
MSGDHGALTTSLVASTELTALVEGIFLGHGVPAADAAVIADHLVTANLRGVDSHGVSRVPVYIERLAGGLVRRDASVTTVRETPVSALLDGNNGSGISVANHAMHRAIDKARAAGIGMVSVRGSNHCGMLAYYTALAARAGLLGFATTSAPATMAPWGATRAFFGTNPLSYAIPMPESHADIVFDMATSQVARGKIILAAREGRRIPLGWALGPDGQPTDDPDAGFAGVMLPLGGPKGSGLALLVETLSSVLSGALYGPWIPPLYDNDTEPQAIGHFFLAVRPDLFRPAAEFTAAMARLATEITELPALAQQDRVYLPGELEAETARHRRAQGIPLSEEVRADLALLDNRANLEEREYGR